MLLAPPFRGDRTYVHVADIIAALRTAWPDADAIRLILRVVPDRAIRVVAGDIAPEAGHRPCGSAVLRQDGQIIKVRLDLVTEQPITARAPYDEEALLDDCIADPSGFVMPGGGPGGIVERLVAGAIETLLQRMPDAFWRIADLRLDFLPADDAAILFRIVTSVGGTFWKARFEADGMPAGEMILALAPPEPAAGL